MADVSIGILIPSSGKGASYGQQQQNAINMFMEKYADIGGKAGKLKLVIYDTRGENTEAINLTRKLMDSDQVVAIIGPQFSAEAEVAFPLAVRGETPMITPMAAKAGIATRQPAVGVPLRADDGERLSPAARCLAEEPVHADQEGRHPHGRARTRFRASTARRCFRRC